MPGIFISYRHDDGKDAAGRLHDRLREIFAGTREIFRDVHSISPGVDWRATIEEALDKCDVMLAVIGPRWVALLKKRLNDPHDWVRHELASALRRRILVQIVQLDKARTLREDQLPSELRGLVARQPSLLRDSDYEDDIKKLVKAIGGAVGTVRVLYGPTARTALFKPGAPVKLVLSLDSFALYLDGNLIGQLDLIRGTEFKVPAGRLHRLQARGGMGNTSFLPSEDTRFTLKGGETITFTVDPEADSGRRIRCVIKPYEPVFRP